MFEMAFQTPPSEALQAYAASLFQRAHEAQVLPRPNVVTDGWQPAANDCHNNADRYCAENPNNTVVRGWLFFELPGAPFCRFVSHSAVCNPEGQLFDITPNNASADYPFLSSGLAEAYYAGVAEELLAAYRSGNLDFWKPN